MKTLATSLVTIQELSENLKAGIALENMHGEFFYMNENWPDFYGTKDLTNSSATAFCPPDIQKEIKGAEAELLRDKIPIGYIIEKNPDKESTIHFVMKFVINYTSGTPFCFCTLAKVVNNEEHLNSLIDKIKNIFQVKDEPAIKLFNHTPVYC